MRKKLEVRRKTKELAARGKPIIKTGERQKRKDAKELALTQIKNNGQKGVHSITHGAFVFQNSYYNGALDRRSHLGHSLLGRCRSLTPSGPVRDRWHETNEQNQHQ